MWNAKAVGLFEGAQVVMMKAMKPREKVMMSVLFLVDLTVIIILIPPAPKEVII
jgi:hypothetical protein